MIEVGEYVRTDNGIRKLVAIDTEYNNYYLEILNSERTMPLAYEVISGWKHSKNIIDLIEEGDYVNGTKVISIIDTYKKHLILENKTECVYAENIKSILTKELYEANCYKVVGGEDEL